MRPPPDTAFPPRQLHTRAVPSWTCIVVRSTGTSHAPTSRCAIPSVTSANRCFVANSQRSPCTHEPSGTPLPPTVQFRGCCPGASSCPVRRPRPIITALQQLANPDARSIVRATPSIFTPDAGLLGCRSTLVHDVGGAGYLTPTRESRRSRYRSTLPCPMPHSMMPTCSMPYRLVNFVLTFRRHRRSSPPTDSNDFPAGRPVRARPSSALPFRSSRTAGAPHAPRTAGIGNGHRNRRTALSTEAIAVAPQLILVSLLTSRRTPQFPAHSNVSATSRSVRTPGTPSTRTLSASPMLRSSRSECAHASGAHPRLSGSGNGLRKRSTSCSPNGGHGTQLILACPPLSTYASVPTHMKTPPDPYFSISRTAQIRPMARMLLGLPRLSRVPIAPCPQSMATRLSFC
jgi:hypothetical protein